MVDRFCTQSWKFSLKDGTGHSAAWANRSRSGLTSVFFVSSVLPVHRRFVAQCSNAFPELATFDPGWLDGSLAQKALEYERSEKQRKEIEGERTR